MFGNFDQSPAVREASAFPAINLQPLMRAVYMWMTIGLAVSGVIAVTLANAFQADLNLLMGLSNLWIVMLIVQIGLAFGLGFLINRISPAVAAGLFITYAVTMGVTLSLIIFGTIASPVVDPRTGAITFTSDWSIVYQAFFVTAGVFGAMTVIGYTTKVNLDRFSGFFIMGMIGVFIASIVNIFLQSSGFSFILSIVVVLLFVGITAWDTQKIKNMAASGEFQEGTDDFGRMAIIGAFMLYSDAIILFIHILRLFAMSRD